MIIFFQAFSVLSDKLTPLLNGVKDNKVHWLEMAQNGQNKTNSTDDDADENKQANNNNHSESNNNTIYRRTSLNTDESSIGNPIGANEIPKIVGKLGRLESHNYFQFKQNGSICENQFREHTSRHIDEAMDQ